MLENVAHNCNLLESHDLLGSRSPLDALFLNFADGPSTSFLGFDDIPYPMVTLMHCIC